MEDNTFADEVVLLSGGNPQIPKGDGDGPVQACIAAMPHWKGEVGRHLDDLINEVVPDVRKAVRWNTPFYGMEGNGWFLSIHCFTKYVKVTFLNCAHLDPAPPVSSKYDHVRSLHIAASDDIDDAQLEDWLRQAASAPGDNTF
jgi:hypothetical protein